MLRQCEERSKRGAARLCVDLLRHARALDEVSNIRRHLFDLGIVELFNVAKITNVTLGDEVYTHSLSTKTTRAADSVDVVFSVCGKIIVNY